MRAARTVRTLRDVLGVAVVIGAAVVVILARPPSGHSSGASDVTALFVQAQPGELVNGYRHHAFLEAGPDWTFSASVTTAKTIKIRAQSSSDIFDFWEIRLDGPDGPDGTLITPGAHEAARSTRSEGRPYLSVSGDNEYCSAGSVGRFTVHQLEMSNPEVVARLAASFELHCYPRVAAVMGEIHFHSSGVGLPAVTVSSEEVLFATPGLTQTITVANRGTTTQDVESRLGGPFPEAYEISRDTCEALLPAATCSIDVRHVPGLDPAPRAELQISDQTQLGIQIVTLTGELTP